MRIAVINKKKCTPERCNFECNKFCPKVRAGVKETVQLTEGKAAIDETLCIGCGICVTKCPFGAIDIVNLPEMKENPIHQYGRNGFRIFNFPIPKRGQVVGLLGPNGIGKTTIVQILIGNVKPNLGKEKATEEEIKKTFKGTETQNYFNELFKTGIKVAYKPQYVDDMPRIFSGKVRNLLEKVDDNKKLDEIAKEFGIEHLLDKELKKISGGELQKVAIIATLLKDADYYFFDEPTSYLDIKERLNIAKSIRQLAEDGKGVFVVEHDLTILDYLADTVHILYGKPAVYGIVSNTYTTKEGINQYLKGYLRDENIRFRDYELKFMLRTARGSKQRFSQISWGEAEKKLGTFKLNITPGTIYQEEIVGIVGANGTGKTTFIKLLAGEEKISKGELPKLLRIAYKPQYLQRENQTVLGYLASQIKIGSKEFRTINGILNIERLFNNNVNELSGGELQQVNITLALCRESDIYLLDEPSAYLDVEQRVNVAKAIKSVMELNSKSAFVVDHDLMFLNYLSDRGMVFKGTPSVKAETIGPQEFDETMNIFLKDLQITFRQDEHTKRPRANKEGSAKDREQKKKGKYFIN